MAKGFKTKRMKFFSRRVVIVVLMVFLALLISTFKAHRPGKIDNGAALAQDRTPEEGGEATIISRQKVQMGELMAALKKNEDKLKEEEKRLDLEKKGMEALRREIEAKIAALSKAKEEVKALVAELKKIESEKIDRLVKIYDGMKPEDAAPLMAKLDRKWTILLLQNMKQNNASKIMALLEPNLAAKLSEDLLGPSWLRRGIDAKKQVDLWKIYEQMKPEEAAALMENFDDEALAQLLIRMKRSTVSKILPLMKAQRARRISQLLAQIDLWKIYEQMKPEEAAALMENFDDEALAQLLIKMKKSTVSKILPLMKAQRATRMSQLLAQKEPKSAQKASSEKEN